MRGYRKMTAIVIGIALNTLLPLVFSHFGVSEGVALASLGSIGTLVALYLGANVASKKYGNE